MTMFSPKCTKVHKTRQKRPTGRGVDVRSLHIVVDTAQAYTKPPNNCQVNIYSVSSEVTRGAVCASPGSCSMSYGTFYRGGRVGPPSKNLDMAQISEKSWELPNFWVPDQNPASPRSGWTPRGYGWWSRTENTPQKVPKTGPFWSNLGLHVKNGLTIFFQTL